jgi:hypothetical protein
MNMKRIAFPVALGALLLAVAPAGAQTRACAVVGFAKHP